MSAVLIEAHKRKAEWRSVALSEVAQIVNGGTPKSSIDGYWDGGVPWLTPKDMGRMDGRAIAATPRTLSEAGLANSSARLVPANSVILSTRAPIGHLAINLVPMAFNQGCRGVVPSANLDHVFLYYFLAANRKLLDDLGVGATFKELSATNLRSVRLPLPPLLEQKRIVAVLDQTFAALNRARAHAQANLADATKLFENWLMSAFSSEASRRPTQNLSQISENLDRLRVPITKADRKPGSVPYYGASGIVDQVAGHIFDDDLLLVSEDGANLLARTYPIAFSISGKSWVNNHAHVLRFNDLDTQEFVRLYLNSISLEPFVSGMAQPKLNQKALNSIPIPLPGSEERRRIVLEARDVRSRAEVARASYEKQLADITNLRQALLQKAFSGELT